MKIELVGVDALTLSEARAIRKLWLSSTNIDFVERGILSEREIYHVGSAIGKLDMTIRFTESNKCKKSS